MVDFDKYEIKSAADLMRFFEKNMYYGFTYRGKIFTDDQQDFQKNMDKFYKLRIGEDFIKNKYGVCWDFCELEREFFISKNIEHECFFIESFTNREDGGPTHTFVLFKSKNKWWWFEYAWQFHRGIWKYSSRKEALKDILEKFKNFFNRKLFDVRLYKTKSIQKRLDTYEYVERCINCERVEL